ncbi:MAG: YraN family protein [Casimicrobium sp.]
MLRTLFARTSEKRARGDVYEARALAFLQSQGLSLVTRNWQSRSGEIDLVMRDGTTLVFVEVRKRSSAAFGGALQSIDAGKTSRIERTAATYLAKLPMRPDYRIDAVAFEANDEPTWIQNILR